jgi:hypothetical protein
VKILRLVLGLIMLAYALTSLAGAAAVASFRLDAWGPPDAIAPAVRDLMAAMSWAQLLAWAAAIALYVVVAIKLLRRVKAFVFWSAAFVLDVVNWLWLRAEGYFDAAIPAGLVYVDYAVLGANLLAGALILLLGRTHLD